MPGFRMAGDSRKDRLTHLTEPVAELLSCQAVLHHVHHDDVGM